MDAFKEEMKRKLILETPVSYEEQSKLIKYLKVGNMLKSTNFYLNSDPGPEFRPGLGLHRILLQVAREDALGSANGLCGESHKEGKRKAEPAKWHGQE